MPEIISFSNRLCYRDQPLVPLRQFGNARLTPVLCPTYVPGGYQEGRGGNLVEAAAVVDAIERCCSDPAYEGKTFGVISLLHSSGQDREIESRLLRRLDAEEIEQRNIVCGNAYDFQGDERDVIFLSMVSARSGDHRIGTLSGDKAKRRFNVAMSRARDQVFLFHSVQEGELAQNCLRRRLLDHMNQPMPDPTAQLPWSVEELREIARTSPRNRGDQPPPFDSWFEVDVYLVIAGQGHMAIPQYEEHGCRIDIVIVGGSRKLAVECDGDVWHGPERYAADLLRQNQLERCGWEFFRVRGSRFYRDPAGALLPLWEMLEPDAEERNSSWSPRGSGADERSEEVAGTGYGGPAELGGTEGVVDGSPTMLEAKGEREPLGGTPLTRLDRERTSVLQRLVACLALRAEALRARPRTAPAPRQRSHRGLAGKKDKIPSGSSLEEVFAMPNRRLGKAICEILEDLPNHSSKKDDLTKKISSRFGFITRGAPRKKLSTKIGWAISHLRKAGKVEVYKAKNVRVRLLHPSGQGRLF